MKKNKYYQKIKNNFNSAAHNYDKNAVLQHEVGRRLVDRLQFFSLKPEVILDLGMGTGATTELLTNSYPDAQIVGLDFAYDMLKTAMQTNLNSVSNACPIAADINQLPFADASIDMIFSNFTMQWCENITQLFQECMRVLKPDGLLFFSIPGPDSLYELRESFNQVSPNYQHVNNFIDMHDLGDILVQTKFGHPVMDSEVFTLTYSNIRNILKDIKAIGANTILADNKPRGLITKSVLDNLNNCYQQHFATDDGKLTLSYEVIYGHAFKTKNPVKVKHPELSEVTVPIEKIIKKQDD